MNKKTWKNNNLIKMNEDVDVKSGNFETYKDVIFDYIQDKVMYSDAMESILTILATLATYTIDNYGNYDLTDEEVVQFVEDGGYGKMIDRHLNNLAYEVEKEADRCGYKSPYMQGPIHDYKPTDRD